MANPAVASPLSVSPASSLKAGRAASPESSGSAGKDAHGNPFSSVLEAKVKSPAPETQGGTASTAAQSKSAGQSEAEGAPAPIDLSALLPMIAAQLAAIADTEGASGPAADGTAGASGTPKAGLDLAAALPAALSAGPANPAALAAEDEPFSLAMAEPRSARPGPADLAAKEGQPGAQLAASVKEAVADLPAPNAQEMSTAEPVVPAHAANPTAEAAERTAIKVDTPVNSPRWSEALAEKVVWVAQRNENRAELVLTPASLGRIEVTVTHSPNGDTSVMFVAANAEARDALEQSLPRLREILGDAGISLGQTGVSAESSPRNGDGDTSPRRDRGEIDALPDDTLATAALAVKSGLGVVDTFV